MVQAKKPDRKLMQQTTYGKLLAGHDMPLGIAAVKAATAASTAGKKFPPELHKNWSKKPKTGN